MSNLKLRIRTTNDLSFTPNRLKINVKSQDILNGTSLISYMLYDNSTINNRYTSRNWSDEGVIELPTEILLQSVDVENHLLNENVFNMLLSGFNLSLTSDEPITEGGLEVQVEPTQGFIFTPNELLIRIVSQDILTSTSIVYFELYDTEIDNSRYVERTWIDKGSVLVPTALLVQSVNNDLTMNESVTNYFLESFNIELVSNIPL